MTADQIPKERLSGHLCDFVPRSEQIRVDTKSCAVVRGGEDALYNRPARKGRATDQINPISRKTTKAGRTKRAGYRRPFSNSAKSVKEGAGC